MSTRLLRATFTPKVTIVFRMKTGHKQSKIKGPNCYLILMLVFWRTRLPWQQMSVEFDVRISSNLHVND